MNTENQTITTELQTRLVILRNEYLDLVSRVAGDVEKKVRYCAAKLIDYLQHWKNWKLSEHRTEWTYLPIKRIYRDLLEEHSVHVIRKAIAFLMEKGLVERRNNPGNGQDRTYQYKLLLDGKKHLSRKSAAETPTPSPFVRSESPEFRSESPEFNVDKYHSFQSIESIPTHSLEREIENQNTSQVEVGTTSPAISSPEEENLWIDKTTTEVPGKDKCSAAVRDTEKVKTPHTSVIKDLLSNRVFLLWWANRVNKSKFSEQLVMAPEAFVRAVIRKHPDQALDMFGAFQEEMERRVDNFQTRVANDCQISPEEKEQIQAIAPYAPTKLPLPEAPTMENAESYKLFQPKQIEAAPPPPDFFKKLKQVAAGLSMPRPAKSALSELDELNEWIADPILKPEAIKRVMTSDLYTIDYDEEGVPFQVKKIEV